MKAIVKVPIYLLVALVNSSVSAQQAAKAPHGMIASSSSLASAAGLSVLKRGGNAVDAACATALALAVTHPAAGNLGGGGFMLIRLADGKSTIIDYRETAPALASRNMYLDENGNMVANSSLVGYRASGVPGTVAGLSLAHARYGKLRWESVVEPALLLAKRGFKLSKSLAQSLRTTKMLGSFDESRRIFQNGGAYFSAGDLFKQQDLAATLKRIQVGGARDFYEGVTAHLIADDQAAHGGLIRMNDLKEYRAVERKPLLGKYRGYDVLTMPPPSSGGIALLEMLHILERYDLAGLSSDVARTNHLVVEAMRRAFADRAEFAGDPDFVKVPVAGLTDERYASEISATIDLNRATPSSQIGHGSPAGHESTQTTHFSVVDGDGNAVSNTYTLNMGYGSGVTVKGAGFLLNDEMDDFAAKPGSPNGFHLIQGEANAIAPQKRPLSSMTPTILLKNGRVVLVTGSPGGPTIISTVLQILVHVIDHKMSLADAVAAPRIHHQWMPDEIRVERGSMPESVRKQMIAMGHLFPRKGGGDGEAWGDAESIAIEPRTGMRVGVTDPRSPDAGAVGN